MTSTLTQSDWTSSTFDRNAERIEWRIEGSVVHLRHGGHVNEGTLTFSLREWKAFVAAAQTGQAGTAPY